MLARALHLLLIAHLVTCPVICGSATCCGAPQDRLDGSVCCEGPTACHRSQDCCDTGDVSQSAPPGPWQPFPSNQNCDCACQGDTPWVSPTGRSIDRSERTLLESVEPLATIAPAAPKRAALGHRRADHKPINGRFVRCLFSSLLC
ncbi:MAG: hypothetical protein CMJ59_24645 [Planctomycetaceae bacterium]|nr:hypothetical protein [Planctomycetaceae bacterium]